MPNYAPDSRDRVRDAVDMVELVGSRTELRRSGVDAYTGLCPFHEERTPSFGIRPSEKVYYCFGCQASGDLFTFVMETEGLDFPGALEYLADRFGVTLEVVAQDPRAAERRRREDRLHELLDRTTAYYERVLWESDEAASARSYLLAERGLAEATLREFRVGYAPSAWNKVLLASRRGGFTEAELLAVGLVSRSRDRPGSVFDRFRSRIMFPLCDRRGRVLGFGARSTSAAERAKYLNTADGEIYHKGRHLFGSHLARASAAKMGAVVLCEGYTDVIAMRQASVSHCVGLMGTALTGEQVGELRGLAPTVILALDADGPGQEAMLRAAELLSHGRCEIRVAATPPGSDPADVLRSEGADAVRAMVEGATALVRFRVDRILAAGDRSTPEGRDGILDLLRPLFAPLGPGAMREELERDVVAAVGVSERLVSQLLGQGAQAAGPGERAVRSGELDHEARAERAMLELCIALPERGTEFLSTAELDELFVDELSHEAAIALRSGQTAGTEGALARLLAELSVRAGARRPVPAELEVAREQLELARVERALAVARANPDRGLTALVRRRQAIKQDLDRWLVAALDETAGDQGRAPR